MAILSLALVPGVASAESSVEKAAPVTSEDAAEAAAANEEAFRWLEKMGVAIVEQSYEGIFTFMRGYQFDTVQVVHRFEDGQEYERLTHLNGEPREIIRRGDSVVCYHADADALDLDHDVLMGPFTHVFTEKMSAFQDLYRFALVGDGRVAGRAAKVLSITPRNGDRYGYRLWLDQETGLLLQSHLVNRGRVLEVFQFSRIDIGEPIDETRLVSTLSDDGVQHPLAIATLATAEELKARSAPSWKVSWLPRGFRAVRSPSPDRAVFTDGLATLTIFVESKDKAQLGELVTNVGGTVVITRPLKASSQQITVVGEVPVDTARRIAESVEPVIY